MNKFVTNNYKYIEVIDKTPDYDNDKLGDGFFGVVYSIGDKSIKIINFY